jgi:hypothetical protein
MGPKSYVWSVVDRIVVMWRIPVLWYRKYEERAQMLQYQLRVKTGDDGTGYSPYLLTYLLHGAESFLTS